VLQGVGRAVHQWTPDVYEGAPTPITGVHGVATKAAAFGRAAARLRRPLIGTQIELGPALATLATITIIVGKRRRARPVIR